MIEQVLKHDCLFSGGDEEKTWLKYCGFLDLALDEFMGIQMAMMAEQIALVKNCAIGRNLMGNHTPFSVEEFRRIVPMTDYAYYDPYFREQCEESLPSKPVAWAHTSGKSGYFKWAPYNASQLGRLADDTIAAFILSAAGERGEVRLKDDERILLNLPAVPYVTGIMAAAAVQRIRFRAIPPLDKAEQMAFSEKVRQGFVMALSSGADYAASLAVVLAKLGDCFSQMGNSPDARASRLPPKAILRLILGMAKAKLANRSLLPKDIWKLKGLVCGGTDASIYRDQIEHHWGLQPLDVYAATETGFMAMQAWDKTTMTFVPYSNFYEFIPEEEHMRSRQNPHYRPATLLMDEIREGRTYEVVITNLNGGPFLRYRIGDLITVASSRNDRAGVALPQIVFRSRADEIIDLAGFARLDEKIVWSAISNIGICFENWSARKEYVDGKPVLRIYLEPCRNGLDEGGAAQAIDEHLMRLDENYKDLRDMMEVKPVVVTFLMRGTFERYMRAQEAAGYDLAHLKPVHINAADSVIDDLFLHGQPVNV